MAMDIPLTLERLTATGRIHLDDEWGPLANSATTYADFAAGWVGPSEVPTEQEMIDAWDFVRMNRYRLKNEAELIATILGASPAQRTAFLANDVVKQRLIFLLLQRFPDLGAAAGFPVSGWTLEFPS